MVTPGVLSKSMFKFSRHRNHSVCIIIMAAFLCTISTSTVSKTQLPHCATLGRIVDLHTNVNLFFYFKLSVKSLTSCLSSGPLLRIELIFSKNYSKWHQDISPEWLHRCGCIGTVPFLYALLWSCLDWVRKWRRIFTASFNFDYLENFLYVKFVSSPFFQKH